MQKYKMPISRLRMMVCLIGMLLPMCMFAQQITVQGVVKDQTGETVIGASVMEKGTTNGTITGIDGDFSLNMSPNGTLVVSFVGYKTQEVQVKGQKQLQVVLSEDAEMLDEVVVIGYGTMKKSDLTGAVSSIGNKDIKDSPVSNLGQAIQGKISGVQIVDAGKPGDNVSIKIRGLGSINNCDPLVVIDGVPTDLGLSSLNMADVERLDVLKDASATAIYGSRGANGVVMITTKRGTEGKGKLAVSANYSFQNATNVPSLLNAAQYAELSNDMMVNSGRNPNPEWANPSTGSDFADSYVAVENAVQEYSWKKSVEELNDILRNHFGATAGENISLEARLTATVTERDEKQVSTTAFSVTAYKPLTSTLYLIGSATPGGWSADDATEMTRKDNGIFTWTGRLVAGEFKFITTLGSFLPSYNKGTDGLLVLRSSDDQPDEPFVVEEDHNYIVEANLFTGVLTLTQTETLAPAYDQLYFVGNATDWGFVKMKQDVLDPYLFRFGKFFEVGKGGEFKFGTSDGSWENMYKAKNADAAYTDTEVVFVKGFDPDNKWVLKDGECGKAYKICMDIRSGKERMMMSEFTPYEMIYMVGDATPAGWTIGDATPMQTTDNPYVFTWKGTLNAGELKFTCDKQEDWNGAWFMSAVADKQPTGETEPMLFLDKSDEAFKAQYLDVMVGGIDQKWKITTAGSYLITLNQLEETISIVKQ